LKREIADAMGTCRVCVCRDTKLDGDSHIPLTRTFGERQIAYRPKGPGDSMRRLTRQSCSTRVTSTQATTSWSTTT
jgi:hypothetical protein